MSECKDAFCKVGGSLNFSFALPLSDTPVVEKTLGFSLEMHTKLPHRWKPPQRQTTCKMLQNEKKRHFSGIVWCTGPEICCVSLFLQPTNEGGERVGEMSGGRLPKSKLRLACYASLPWEFKRRLIRLPATYNSSGVHPPPPFQPLGGPPWSQCTGADFRGGAPFIAMTPPEGSAGRLGAAHKLRKLTDAGGGGEWAAGPPVKQTQAVPWQPMPSGGAGADRWGWTAPDFRLA